MSKKLIGLVALMLVSLLLAACGDVTNTSTTAVTTAAVTTSAPTTSAPVTSGTATTAAAATGAQTVNYLGKAYSLPSKPVRIIALAYEAFEDALVLGVKPIGAPTVGGKFPGIFSPIAAEIKPIGERTQPNLETMLSLKPDVILSSSKFPAETAEKFAKIAPSFPVSHISTNWEANLNLLAELTGKQDQARQIIQKYKDDAKAGKEKLSATLAGKKVVVARIRQGAINLYPADVYLNPVIYSDLGLAVPEEIKLVKAQEIISTEKFAEMNPDYVFLQFSEEENADKPKSLEDLQKNPIWQSTKAAKNGKVFVNAIDPIAQGGTAWSKINFLSTALAKLA